MKEARIGDCVYVDGRRFSRYRHSLRCWATVIGIQRKTYVLNIPDIHPGIEKIVVAKSMVYDVSFVGPRRWRRHYGSYEV